MRRLALLLAAAAMPAAPALAQHQGHGGHTMPMPKPAPKKPAAKPAAKKAPAKKSAARPTAPKKAAPKKAAAPKPAAKKPAADPHAAHKAPAKPAADPHAGHQMSDPPAKPDAQADPHAGQDREVQQADPHTGHGAAGQQADPHAGHAMEAQQPDPHAGHGAAGQQADPHAGHDMDASPPAPPIAPPPPAAFSGPAHAADLVFGAEQMAEAREELRAEHGDMRVGKVLIDRVEASIRDGRDGYQWDADGWYGGDIDKIWVKTEGEGEFGGPSTPQTASLRMNSVEAAEVQALWSRAIGPFFDLQAGLRYDIRPRPGRSHLVLGIQGLAPYWFEVDAAAFLSEKGDLTARLEAEYDQRITQRLILQPRFEFDLAAQDVPELGIGSGLSTAELGLRLRYEFEPRFAPYVGVEYERAFGDTADFRRAAGEDAGGWSLLMGIRAWF
jgi:copper resistance protein B